MPGSMSELTDKQRLFIAEYLVDCNATRAAIAAGYSEETARQMGSENLSKPDIAAEISKRLDKRMDKLGINADNVIAELGLLAFSNMMDYLSITDEGSAFVDLSRLTRAQAAAIQEFTVDETAGGSGDGRRERVQRTRFKLADKGMNLERLGRYFKLFTDKMEVSGLDGIADHLEQIRKAKHATG